MIDEADPQALEGAKVTVSCEAGYTFYEVKVYVVKYLGAGIYYGVTKHGDHDIFFRWGGRVWIEISFSEVLKVVELVESS